jgi:hypothetical protein
MLKWIATDKCRGRFVGSIGDEEKKLFYKIGTRYASSGMDCDLMWRFFIWHLWTMAEALAL